MTSEFNRTALFSRVQPGGVFTVNDLKDHPGNIFFVDSGETVNGANAVGFGRSPDAPFLTLDYAVAFCTANNGDVIYVMPGHAESLTADSAVDLDVAGIKVIGLGTGGSRPTFTCTVAAGDFKLAGAGCGWIENLLFLNAVDQSTGLLEVSAPDWTIKNCDIRESDSTAAQANVYLITTADANRLHIDGLTINEGGADAGPVSAIDFVGADDLHLENFYIYGNFSTTPVQMLTTACLRVRIHDGTIWQANAADTGIVDTVTNSTGFVGPNLLIKLADNAANITEAVTGATFQVIDPVYVVNLVNEKAMLINWTASTDA